MCRDVAKVVFSLPILMDGITRAALYLRHIGPALHPTSKLLLIERLNTRMSEGCVSGLGTVCSGQTARRWSSR